MINGQLADVHLGLFKVNRQVTGGLVGVAQMGWTSGEKDQFIFRFPIDQGRSIGI